MESVELLNLYNFTEIDRQFARLMTMLSCNDSIGLILAALIASNQTGKGNICVDIPSIAGRELFDVLDGSEESNPKFKLPDEEEWIAELQSCSVVGEPEDYKPLILDNDGLLYLYRYWAYERVLSTNIRRRLDCVPDDIDIKLLKDGISRLFPKDGEGDNWQLIASLSAVMRCMCIISGGPGTGKTSTVVKILVLLLEQAQARGYIPAIALAAPTGKAAAKLKDSIKNSRALLNCSDSIRVAILDETFTIHRLLESIPGSPSFRYNAENQLRYDIIVIDESSMSDIALLTKLFEAIPLKSRIILLGDKDQLASIEAGAVLGDICDTGNEHGYSRDFINMVSQLIGSENPLLNRFADEPPIADSLIILRQSYRFGQNSGIEALSLAVRDGDADDAIGILHDESFNDVSLINIMPDNSIRMAISEYIISGYKPYLTTETPEKAYQLFSRFAILCMIRQGAYGVNKINELVEGVLKDEGLIALENRWYRGRPVMINRNDYSLKLFNGDSGIILPETGGDNKPRFFCPKPEGGFRTILPLKLPEHETVYAMTVHKCQGSEFEHALVLLPDRPNLALSRELIYTAITRAKKRVDIIGNEQILRYMINRPTLRKSGLRKLLWS
ncbi:MAG: exodeoxyribonuclease V subunit alpha [Spirochaetota bacterium]|nr:exodeoxyribonuclease V subunit alpha [Spirochaetota bacterium]